jgi:hypothetical protein
VAAGPLSGSAAGPSAFLTDAAWALTWCSRASRPALKASTEQLVPAGVPEGMVFLLVGRGGFPQDRGDLGLQPCQP